MPGKVFPFGPFARLLQPAAPTARNTTAAIAGAQRLRFVRANTKIIRNNPSNDATGISNSRGAPHRPEGPATGGVPLQNVVTEIPVFTDPVPVSTMLVGVTEQVIVGVLGSQLKSTVPLVPGEPVSTIGNTAVSPGLTVALVLPFPPAVNVNVFGDCVVPLSATVCGLSIALSVIVKVPLLGSVPVGVKVTLMVQEFPTVTPLVSMQLPLATANGPLAEICEKLITAPLLLVLVTVTGIGALVAFCSVDGKVRLVGATVTVVCGTSVVPFNGTLCGLFGALSAIESVPLLGSVPEGVNVTAIVHEAPAAIGEASVEQVPPETANGPPSPAEMLVNEIVPPPVLVFFTVTDIGLLVVFCAVAGNVKLPGVICTEITGIKVVPFNGTLCGLFGALSAIVKVPLLAAVPVGVNVTAIVQLAPAASGEASVEQVPPETANGPSPVEIFVNVIVPPPVLVFFTVTDIGLLVVFCSVAGNVNVPGVTVTEIVCAVVVPLNATNCGLPVALSVIDKFPLLAAVPVGVNVTVIVHVAFCAMPAPLVEQVPPETAKGPVVEILEKVMFVAKLLVFFTVTVIGALVVFSICAGNVRLGGVVVSEIVCTNVVPLNGTSCGLPVALSVTDKFPLLGAVPVGVNVTVIVQVAFCAIPGPDVEQVPPETAKGPVVEIAEKVTFVAVLLVFFTVTVIGALVTFCTVAGNVSDGGVNVTDIAGGVVVPLKGTN